MKYEFLELRGLLQINSRLVLMPHHHGHDVLVLFLFRLAIANCDEKAEMGVLTF